MQILWIFFILNLCLSFQRFIGFNVLNQFAIFMSNFHPAAQSYYISCPALLFWTNHHEHTICQNKAAVIKSIIVWITPKPPWSQLCVILGVKVVKKIILIFLPLKYWSVFWSWKDLIQSIRLTHMIGQASSSVISNSSEKKHWECWKCI